LLPASPRFDSCQGTDSCEEGKKERN
jgi:hypothetical protein